MFNNLYLVTLCKKLITDDKKIKVYTLDIFYHYINNLNKKEFSEEKVILSSRS